MTDREMSAPSGRSGSVWPVLTAALLTLLAAGALYWPIALDLDVSYYASVGKVISQGQTLYYDYLEGNPLGPVLVARLSYTLSEFFGTPFDQTHKYVLFALQSGLALLALAVLAPALQRAGSSGPLFAAGLALVGVLMTPDIGRRDYVGALLMLPWAAAILMAWAEAHRNRALTLPVGVVAGLAMLFKPHFAALALAIGIADLIRARGRPWQLLPESWIALVTCLGSYLWFWLTYPVYFTDIIPFALETFGRLQHGPMEALRRLAGAQWLSGGALLLIAGAVVLRITDRAGGWLGPVSLMVMLASGAGLAIYTVQGFGLHYHLLPLRVTLFTALFALGAWAVGRNRAIWMRAGGLLLCAALAAYLARPFLHQPSRTHFAEHPLTRAMTPDTPGAPILMISSSVRPTGLIYPFIDASWAGVSLVHWPIVTLIRQDGRYATERHVPEARRVELADWYRGRMAERLSAAPPERVAVDVSNYLRFFEDSDFDILAWLREHPDFDAAWRAGRLEPNGDPVEIDGRRFQLYRPAGD